MKREGAFAQGGPRSATDLTFEVCLFLAVEDLNKIFKVAIQIYRY